jgi:hypothetical protein
MLLIAENLYITASLLPSIFFKRAHDMSQQQEYEMLKAEMLQYNAAYIDAVTNASFDDLDDINERILLVESYAKFVKSNIAYKNFVHKNKWYKAEPVKGA